MNERSYAENGEYSESEGANWDDFRVFLEVIRTGSFNKAAVRLRLTQATVSRRLARLETAIGTRLFDRDRRGPRLTADGQRIFNDANAAHNALLRAASRSDPAREGVEGECKIVISDGLASFWLTRFLAPFFARYPKIQLKLLPASDVASEKRDYDLLVHYYEPREADSGSLRLATMHLIPFASVDYLREHGTPKSIEDLAGHRLIELAHYLNDAGSWPNWSPGAADRRALLSTSSSVCVAEAVRLGAGIAVVPTYAGAVDAAYVPLDVGMRFQVPVNVSYGRDAPKSWAVRTTLEFLRHNVFDQKNMPWFQDAYVAPAEDWPDRLAALRQEMARAQLRRERKLASVT